MIRLLIAIVVLPWATCAWSQVEKKIGEKKDDRRDDVKKGENRKDFGEEFKKAGEKKDSKRVGPRDRPLAEWLKQITADATGERAEAARALGHFGAPAVGALSTALGDKDARVRLAAAEGLTEIGPDARAAVPALVKALSDDGVGDERKGRYYVRNAAADALIRIGSDAAPAVKETYLNKNADAHQRAAALSVLGRMGPKAGDIVPILRAALSDQIPTLRGSAAVLLSERGERDDAVVAGLLDALKEGDAGLRTMGVRQLREFGPTVANRALPALTAALQDNDAQVQIAAADTLAALGPAAKQAATALISALKSRGNVGPFTHTSAGSSSVRYGATAALLKMGPEAEAMLLKDGLPILIDGLQDAEDGVLGHTAEAIALLGPKAASAVPHLAKLIKGRHEFLRRAVIESLAQMGSAGVPPLVELLRDPDIKIRRDAVYKIQHSRELDPRLTSALIDLLTDKDSEVKAGAAEGLSWTRAAKPEHLPKLIALLKDPDLFDARGRFGGRPLVIILVQIGPPAIPELIKALKAEDLLARAQAADALGAMGRKAAEAVPALREALRDEYAIVVLLSATALILVGGDAEQPLAVLTGALEHPTPFIRWYGLDGLGKAGPKAKSSVDAVVKVLKDRETNVRRKAVETLLRLGEGAGPALTAAAPDLLKSDNLWFRSEVVRALGKLARKSPEAVAVIVPVLKDPNDNVRRDAAEALVEFGPVAKSAVPALMEALRRSDEFGRSEIAKALGSIGADAAPAVPQIVELLKASSEYTRKDALRALGDIGPAAKSALPSVRLLLKDEVKSVRAWAAFALVRISGEPKEGVDMLIVLLEDKSQKTHFGADLFQGAAAEAAARLGPVAQRALPAVIEAAKGEAATYPAVAALGKFGEPAVSTLIELLSRERTRQMAAQVLGEMGPAAKPAVPHLQKLLNDKKDYVVETAQEALRRIRGE